MFEINFFFIEFEQAMDLFEQSERLEMTVMFENQQISYFVERIEFRNLKLVLGKQVKLHFEGDDHVVLLNLKRMNERTNLLEARIHVSYCLENRINLVSVDSLGKQVGVMNFRFTWITKAASRALNCYVILKQIQIKPTQATEQELVDQGFEFRTDNKIYFINSNYDYDSAKIKYVFYKVKIYLNRNSVFQLRLFEHISGFVNSTTVPLLNNRLNNRDEYLVKLNCNLSKFELNSQLMLPLTDKYENEIGYAAFDFFSIDKETKPVVEDKAKIPKETTRNYFDSKIEVEQSDVKEEEKQAVGEADSNTLKVQDQELLSHSDEDNSIIEESLTLIKNKHSLKKTEAENLLTKSLIPEKHKTSLESSKIPTLKNDSKPSGLRSTRKVVEESENIQTSNLQSRYSSFRNSKDNQVPVYTQLIKNESERVLSSIDVNSRIKESQKRLSELKKNDQ